MDPGPWIQSLIIGDYVNYASDTPVAQDACHRTSVQFRDMARSAPKATRLRGRPGPRASIRICGPSVLFRHTTRVDGATIRPGLCSRSGRARVGRSVQGREDEQETCRTRAWAGSLVRSV